MSAWVDAYERANASCKELKAELREQEMNARQSGMSASAVRGLRNGLAALQRQVIKLDQDLGRQEANPAASRITPRELARRRDMLSNLKVQKDQIGAAIGGQGSGSNSDRNKLFAGRGQAPSYAVRSTEADQTRDLDDRGVLQMQRDMIRDQDQTLSKLSEGISNLQDIGGAIGEEVDLQSRLLDDLHDGVEDADNSLQSKTKHADKVRKKGAVCWMYCIIVLLVIILLFLVITQGGKKL